MFARDNGICRALYPARLSLPPNRNRRTSVRFFFFSFFFSLTISPKRASRAFSCFPRISTGHESNIHSRIRAASINMFDEIWIMVPMDAAGRFKSRTKKSSTTSVHMSWCVHRRSVWTMPFLRTFIAANFNISELNRIFAPWLIQSFLKIRISIYDIKYIKNSSYNTSILHINVATSNGFQ